MSREQVIRERGAVGFWVPRSPEDWQNATPEQIRSFNNAVVADVIATREKESAMAPAEGPPIDPYPRVRADQYPADAPAEGDRLPREWRARVSKIQELRAQAQKMIAEAAEMDAALRREAIEVAKRNVEALHALGIDATLNVQGERLG